MKTGSLLILKIVVHNSNLRSLKRYHIQYHNVKIKGIKLQYDQAVADVVARHQHTLRLDLYEFSHRSRGATKQTCADYLLRDRFAQYLHYVTHACDVDACTAKEELKMITLLVFRNKALLNLLCYCYKPGIAGCIYEL